MSTTVHVCKFHRQLLQRYGWKLLTLRLPAAPVAAHIQSWARLCHWGVQRHLCQAATPITQHTLLEDEASLQKSEAPRKPVSTQTASQHIAVHPSVPIPPKVKEILHSLRTGSRSSLAEAITLVETKHPVKHHHAQWLLTKVLSHRSKQLQLGKLKPTLRIGLSGPPGAGKSTIIERLGQLLTTKGFKVAVLAVDPSSSRTGGSILGDKTRMPNLSKDPRAYIRPSPSGGSLGGVTRSTSEAISLCEGAGYDIIIVETVGVGQSETAVCDMADIFVLIIPPAAGDELQGLKKGIVELADLVVINKADGDLLPAAQRIRGEYTSALKLSRNKTPHWQPKVLMLSALSGKGLEELWKTVEKYCQKMKDSQEFDAKRKNQQRLWLWNHINWQLRERFKSHPGMNKHIDAMENRVMAGSLAPGTAADLLLDEFIKLK